MIQIPLSVTFTASRLTIDKTKAHDLQRGSDTTSGGSDTTQTKAHDLTRNSDARLKALALLAVTFTASSSILDKTKSRHVAQMFVLRLMLCWQWPSRQAVKTKIDKIKIDKTKTHDQEQLGCSSYGPR